MKATSKGKLTPLLLGVTCLILATTWIGWKDAFADIGSYGSTAGPFQVNGQHSSNYVACDNSNNQSSLIVTLAQGSNITVNSIGSSCETALDSFPSSCKVAAETQEVNGTKLATLFRIICD